MFLHFNSGCIPASIAYIGAPRIPRWPGGSFVSGYEWRTAIGDPDKRPPIMDPIWHAVQPNDVGTNRSYFLTSKRTVCCLLEQLAAPAVRGPELGSLDCLNAGYLSYVTARMSLPN